MISNRASSFDFTDQQMQGYSFNNAFAE